MTEPQEHDNELDDGVLDRALDGGFEAAGDAAQTETDPAPSVLERIGEITGEQPRISLRDADAAGHTPMLKPLGPADMRQAGKYVVHGQLGHGGVGAVHRGHDQDLGRDSNVLEVLITRLRKKLDPDRRLNVIETLRGRGYRIPVPEQPNATP